MEKLAIDGGNPTRTKPFGNWPIIKPKYMDALKSALESGFWGIGSNHIKEFEEKFALLQDAKHCLSINNGTWALWVALKACGIKAGDEVILPPYTFIATGSSVLMANAVPVFIDIDPDTYNIDPDLLEDAITDKTKAIIAVHIAGNPADMDRILAIANKYELKVIEDAAQAHFAEYNGRKVGAIGDCGTFSFQSSKNMCAGEGGALTTNAENIYNLAFSYQNCGRTIGGAWYEHNVLGSNNRITAFQAAILNAQMADAKEYDKIRNENASYLRAELSEIDGITPLTMYKNTTNNAYHLFIFKYNSDEFNNKPREWFIEALTREGIFCHKGYVPLYREQLFVLDEKEYPWIKGRDYKNLNLPHCEKACDYEAVWLKQSMLLGSKEDMDDIISAINKIKENC